MNTHFLTKEKAIYVGLYDALYELYCNIGDLFEEAYNTYQQGKTNSYARLSKIEDTVLRPYFREKANALLEKYTYLFTDEYKAIHPNSASIKTFSFIDAKDLRAIYLNTYSVAFPKIISFSQFLVEFEFFIITILYQRKLHQYPKFSLERVEKETQEHFNNIVEASLEKAENNSFQNQIILNDVLIFKKLSSISCNRKNHIIEPKTIIAAIVDSNDTILLPVHYCKNCNKIFIGNETLKVYEKKYGKLFLSVRKDYSDDEAHSYYTGESKLHKAGYNVIAGKLSEKERENYLIKLYETKIFTEFEIVRDIENAIQIFDGRICYAEAVKKWKTDLLFITEYIRNTGCN